MLEVFPRLSDEKSQAWFDIINRTQAFRYLAKTMLGTRLGALLNYLFTQSGSAGSLPVTHQVLAQELGSSRESIGRLFIKMEKKEFIVLMRGKILPGRNEIQLKDACNLLIDGCFF